MRVAAGSVDYSSTEIFSMGAIGQDIAPNRRILTTAVVDHDNAAGWHVIDVISDRTARICDGRVRQRECSPDQPKTRIEGFDSEALSSDTELVECVADRGSVYPAGTINIAIRGAGHWGLPASSDS